MKKKSSRTVKIPKYSYREKEWRYAVKMYWVKWTFEPLKGSIDTQINHIYLFKKKLMPSTCPQCRPVAYTSVIYPDPVYNIIKAFSHIMTVGVCTYVYVRCIPNVKDFEKLSRNCKPNLRFLTFHFRV